ncbi:hypothetical protein [Deinococcus sp.]|uniref:hypothetical protein n=1 Tax=Deinococcus sp. TaxID=47478 RepID=UPI0025CC4249|nr:hypothetical protein [Deinococcus sp.]
MKPSAAVASLLTAALISPATAQSAAQTKPQTSKTAPSTSFGVNTLGAQVTYDTGTFALRLSVGGRTALGLVYGVGADVAALYPVYQDTQAASKLSLGAGVDVNYFFASPFLGNGGDINGSVVSYRPHVLLNYEHSMSLNSSFFLETSLGYAFIPSIGAAIYPGLRLGLNFH